MADPKDRTVLIPVQADDLYLAEVAVLRDERRDFEQREQAKAAAAIQRFMERLLGKGPRIVLPS